MQKLHRVIKNAVEIYYTLPGELKIPFSLYLSVLILFEKVLLFISTSLQKFKPSLHKLQKIMVRKPKKHHRSAYRLQRVSKKKPPRYSLPVFTKLKYFLLGTTFSLIFAFLPLLFMIFLQDLPQPQELSSRQIAQTTKIYDRNKTLLYEIYANQNRTLISLNDVPKHMQQATLAIEDKNFYKHPGFDITSIIRAIKENMEEGGTLQGGSTITQQLIKSSLLTSEKNFSRKAKEIVIAFWAERIYTKDQILEMYFNQIPYGGTAWGVEAAAEVYFDKHVKDLNLSESAFLAGLTQAPSQYSPFGPTPELWPQRQKEVLKRMVALGYITQKQADAAAKQKLSFKKQDVPLRAPHFVMYIKDLLIQEYGLPTVEKGGMEVITSLDLKTQQTAEKIVAEQVAQDSYLNLSNGAVLVTDPRNGDILAMVGGKDYNDPNGGNVNVTTSHRQPGSTVKAITYSAALMNGFTAASILEDTPISFPNPGSSPYTPVNYDGKFRGRVPLRFALANSLNIPAVKTLNKVGVTNMVALANKMGLSSWDPEQNYGLSITLGGVEATMLDMATVFGTLSNNGNRVTLDPILTINTYKGSVVKEKTVEETRALPQGVAYIISDILSDNQSRSAAFGTSSPLNIPGHTASVKTGTSDNKDDNWTIGYTKNYVVTVWVGNNDGSPMSPTLASGITGAAPIWHKVMTNLLANKADSKPAIPSDVTYKPCFGRTEFFLRGTENTVNCGNNFPSPRIFTIND